MQEQNSTTLMKLLGEPRTGRRRWPCRKLPPCTTGFFYEKVIKVKADVAAFLIFFPTSRELRWCGELSRAPFLAFILTLDSSPHHFIIERGTKRNAQFS